MTATTLANTWLSGHIVQRAAERELHTAQAFSEASIDAEADRALLLADSLARNPPSAPRSLPATATNWHGCWRRPSPS